MIHKVTVMFTVVGPIFAKVNNIPVNCLIDSRASLSVISQNSVEFLNLTDSVDTGNKCLVRSFTGHTYPSKGSLRITFTALGVQHEIVSQVFDVP